MDIFQFLNFDSTVSKESKEESAKNKFEMIVCKEVKIKHSGAVNKIIDTYIKWIKGGQELNPEGHQMILT